MRRAHQGKHSHENRAIGHRLKSHGRFFTALMLCGLLASSTVLPAQAVGPDASDAPGDSVVEATEISEEAGTEPESTEPEAELDEPDAGESGSKTDDSGADEPLAAEREISESSSGDSAKAPERLAEKARGLNDFQECAVEVYAVTRGGQVAEYPSGSLSGGWSSLNGLSNSVNALGIAPGGASAYAVERNTGEADAGTIKSILKYENGEYSRVPNSGISSFGPVDTTGLPSGARLEGDQSQAGVVAGAVSPDNGHFYFGGFERVKYRVGSSTSSSNPRYMLYTLVYFEYDPVTDQIHGPKRASLPPLLLNDKDHYPSANGDFAFDSEGNLFILSGTDQEEAGNPLAYYNNAHVYRIGKQSLQSANPTATRVSMSGITGSGHNPRMGYANGIAFNGAGNMVISIGASAPYNAREYRSQNGSWSLVSSNSTSIAATDLASCESPSTLTIQKEVIERGESSDQFILKLSSSQGGTPFEEAETSGASNGIQLQKIGPTIVGQGATYYFAETGTAGTDLGEYTSSYECVNTKTGAPIDDGEGDGTGDGTSGRVTIPADPAGSSVVCTFSNTPKSPEPPATCDVDAVYLQAYNGRVGSISTESSAVDNSLTLLESANSVYTGFPTNSGFTRQGANGLAIAADGTMYGYARLSNSTNTSWYAGLMMTDDDGNWVKAPVNSSQVTANGWFDTGSVQLIAGSVDPITGNYVFGGYGWGGTGTSSSARITLYEYDGASIKTLGYATVSAPGVSGANPAAGDFAFDASGNLFVVRGQQGSGAAGSYTITTIKKDALEAARASTTSGAIPSSSTNRIPTDRFRIGGIAVLADGSLALANEYEVWRVDPANPGVSLGTIRDDNFETGTGQNPRITDLASCATATTITVEKDVVGRFAPTDQFTLDFTTATADPLNSGTTTGDSTGAREVIAPTMVMVGGSYTLSETGGGTPAANLANYDTTLECTVDGSGGETVIAVTSTTSSAITIPASAAGKNVTCTFTNTPKVNGEVIWEKVDDQTPAKLLGGSEWKVVGPAPSTAEMPVPDCVAANVADCTGSDKDPEEGKFKVSGLALGVYELIETKAPAGYKLDADPHEFTVASGAGGSVDLGSIVNEQLDGPTIPLTGGQSALIYSLIGGVLIALLVAGVLYRRYSLKRALPGSVAASA